MPDRRNRSDGPRSVSAQEKMKRHILFTLGAFFALLCLLTGRAELSYADKEEISSVQIAFAADLHYISPKLTDKGPLFQ